MALKITKNINVDFYDSRYILINAKQYDGSSRYITVTCYDQGKIFNLSSTKHSVYVKYKKADGNTVFNFCTITTRGQIEIELTEQMLAESGICDVDLVIINKGNAVVDINTGKITTIDNSEIIATMVFRIDVYESAVDNSLIESSNEFNGLTEALKKSEAEYERVIDASESWSSMAQSYAIGGTGIEGRKEIEDTDNAKYYSIQSSDSADKSESYAIGGTGTRIGEDVDNAEYYSRLAKSYAVGNSYGSTGTRNNESTENAKSYMENANTYMQNAQAYMESAKKHMNTTNGYMKTTEAYKNSANESAVAAARDMNATSGYMGTTSGYMSTTKNYMDTASGHANTASGYAKSAYSYSTEARSYAVGGTNTRDGEDTDNSRYYYEMVKTIVNGLNSGFIPMGTITFSELSTVEKATGFTYNIKDDFVTDETFREGSGIPYTAGTNVYYTADGVWDCLGGSASVVADINEIKDYLGI